MKDQIFVPMIGQYDNVGDIILRRPLLAWLRPLGVLHVYVGHAPDGYVKGLQVQAQDYVYRSFPRWYGKGLLAATSGRAHYVFKPGEIQLSVRGMKEHLGMLPLLVSIRARGGKIVRVGSGARNFASLSRIFLWPSLVLSQLVYWRDEDTARFLGKGAVMPDLAFLEGDDLRSIGQGRARPLLVVSMRGDRPPPTRSWFDAIATYARARGLEVLVVTQVSRDRARCEELASILKADLLDWDGTGHHVHEQKLRSVYRRAKSVVSDRLHVLIAAYTHGALPIALVTDGSKKIPRHLSAARMPPVYVDTQGLTASEIMREVETIERREAEIHAALGPTREILQGVRAQVTQLLTGDRSDFEAL
jgi:hypothetical protein